MGREEGGAFWEVRKSTKNGKAGEKLNQTVFGFSTSGFENFTSV